MKEIDNTFYNDIRIILQQARNKAYSAVNYAMVEAYWSIGKRIVEEEQKGKERADYGANLIKTCLLHLILSLEKDFLLPTYGIFVSFILYFQVMKNSTHCVEN